MVLRKADRPTPYVLACRTQPPSRARVGPSCCPPAHHFAVVSNVIWVMMGKRIRKTGKMMPSAPVGALALGMAFFYIFQMTKTTKANFKPAAADDAPAKKES